MFLLVIGLITGRVLSDAKVTVVHENGLITDLDLAPVGVARAVHVHGVMEFPSLQLTDLRRLEDVVLHFDNSTHFFRVASVTRVAEDIVRVAAEDGTRIQVTSERVTVARPTLPETVLLPSEVVA